MKMKKEKKMIKHEAGPTNPPEVPDVPERDDIPHQFWRSGCCGESVREAYNGALICVCFRFCKVDIDKSLEAWKGNDYE